MSLFDSVVEQNISCKVPGCHNTWTLGAKEIVDNWKHNNYHAPKRMCPECHQILKNLAPQTIPCSTKSCDGAVTIPVYQQLIAEKKHRPLHKQSFFCEECQKLLKTTEDKDITCRMKGCHNTWKWFASSQLKQGGAQLETRPESRLCDSCYRTLQKLSPVQQPCRVHTCDRTWQLDRMTQLEIHVHGKKVPKRMCSVCNSRLKQLSPIEQVCQVDGCDNTWSWLPYAQLEYEHKKAVEPSISLPQRYCNSCFSLMKRLKPASTPCSKNSCTNSIGYSIEAQLEDIVQNKKRPHHQLRCKGCQEHYDLLDNKKLLCQQEGCEQTWEWGKEDQFAASFFQNGTLITGKLPNHYCQRCHDFLHNRPDSHVKCQQCEAPILWTSRQQLMTELNLWVAPRLCPNCLKKS
ncbi:MAG: hypothetical protein HQM14_09000 [SAR324 cluster bacterium]|nr:hypothetical protein [SAR324 cluster bacterium]